MPIRNLAATIALAGILSAGPAFAQDATKPVEAGSTSALFGVVGLAMDDELNIRATATPTGVVIARVPNGTSLKNRGCMTVNNYVWCKVEYPEDATVVGWSPGRYLVELPGSGTAENLPTVPETGSAGSGASTKAGETSVAEATDGIMGSKVFGPPDESAGRDDEVAAVAVVQAIAEGVATDGAPVAAPPGTLQLPVTLGEQLAEIEPDTAASAAPLRAPVAPFVIEKVEAQPGKETQAPRDAEPAPRLPEGEAATTVRTAKTEVTSLESTVAPAPPPTASAGDAAPEAAATPDVAKPAIPDVAKPVVSDVATPAVPDVAKGASAPEPEMAGVPAQAAPAEDSAKQPPVAIADTPKPVPAESDIASAGDGHADDGGDASLAKPDRVAAAPDMGAAPPAGNSGADGGADAEEAADLGSEMSGLEMLRARFGKFDTREEPDSKGVSADGGAELALNQPENAGSSSPSEAAVAGNPAAEDAGTDVAAAVRDHDAVKNATGGFDATGEVSCARLFGQPMGRCEAGVLRGEKGEAMVTVIWPDGGQRIIRFRGGQVEGSDAGEPVTAVREAELNMIRVGKGERFEIPDSFAFGG
jgi:hypothetical protein